MRRFPTLPPQVLRLALLALGIVSSYGVARYLLTPPSFGEYGFYRGAALQEIASRPTVYAGKKACDVCHDEVFQVFNKFEHKQLSCEACHGAGQAHSENPDIGMQKLHYSHCVRCHEQDPSRPATHKQIVAAEHFTGSKCTECHLPHAPSEVP